MPVFYWEKVADRNVWDFALVNIAVAMKLNGDVIEDSRFVCGAVECKPRRLLEVERAVRGQPRGDATAQAVHGIASRGARALTHNSYKIPMMDNLVKRALTA
jgi:xanthine dehydrogenase YagS FAD-binding subunit